MKKLVIIGPGNFGREVWFHAQNSLGYGSEFVLKGYIDGTEKAEPESYEKLELPLLGDVYSYQVGPDDVFVIAIANTKAKESIAKIMDDKGVEWYTLIHKTALVALNAKVGRGVILCPFCCVDVNAVIGNHVSMNLFSNIGHDAQVGEYTSIMCHVDITGWIKAGKGTFWGSGAHALPHAEIGDGAVIGAGALILKKAEPGKTYVGVPAKELR